MTKAQLLLVTGFPDERAIYGESFAASGFDVVIPEGPDEALEIATAQQPDIIVTRILQPGHTQNGLDLLRRLKADPKTASSPVVIITSLMQPEFRAAAIEARCDGYFLLPVSPDDLVAEVQRITARSQKTAGSGS